MDYNKALNLVNSARDAENGKPCGAHTRLYKRGDNVALCYHITDVITWRPDGSIVLNSGGWRTKTTKERINEYADGVRLSQCNSVWSVSRNGGASHNFADGIILHRDGTAENAAPVDDVERIKQLKKRVNTYAVKFIDELYKGNISEPSGGDCWMCLMGTDGGEHLTAHLDESYFVPSLLINALKEFGASRIDAQTARALMAKQPQYAYWKDRNSYGAKSFAKNIKRFMLRKMGEVA